MIVFFCTKILFIFVLRNLKKITKMTTTEKNKLIAELLGFNFDRFQNEGIIEPPQKTFFYQQNPTFTLEELRFHNDWNWLMELVEFIEKSGFIDEFEVKYCSVYGNIVSVKPFYKDSFSQYGSEGIFDKKIDAVYNACVGYLEYYNEKIKISNKL